MNMFGVSFIIPVYNTSIEYLKGCLDSIESNLIDKYEIILVDDGSDEYMISGIRNLASKYDKVRFFEMDHLGVSGARNYGLSVSKYSYITFVDSDDLISSSFLDVLYPIIKKNEVDIISFRITRNESELDKDKNILSFHAFDSSESIDVFSNIFDTTHGHTKPYNMITREVAGKVYKLDFLRKNKIVFDIDLQYGEDMMFIAESLKKKPKIISISNILYYYRINEYSVLHQFSKDKTYNIINLINKVNDFGKHLSMCESKMINWCVYGLIHDIIKDLFYYHQSKNDLKEENEIWNLITNNMNVRKAFSQITEEATYKQKIIIYSILLRRKMILKMIFKFMQRG